MSAATFLGFSIAMSAYEVRSHWVGLDVQDDSIGDQHESHTGSHQWVWTFPIVQGVEPGAGGDPNAGGRMYAAVTAHREVHGFGNLFDFAAPQYQGVPLPTSVSEALYAIQKGATRVSASGAGIAVGAFFQFAGHTKVHVVTRRVGNVLDFSPGVPQDVATDTVLDFTPTARVAWDRYSRRSYVVGADGVHRLTVTLREQT